MGATQDPSAFLKKEATKEMRKAGVGDADVPPGWLQGVVDQMCGVLRQQGVPADQFWESSIPWFKGTLENACPAAYTRAPIKPRAAADSASAPAPGAQLTRAQKAEAKKNTNPLFEELKKLDPNTNKSDYFEDGVWDEAAMNEDLALAKQFPSAEEKPKPLQVGTTVTIITDDLPFPGKITKVDVNSAFPYTIEYDDDDVDTEQLQMGNGTFSSGDGQTGTYTVTGFVKPKPKAQPSRAQVAQRRQAQKQSAAAAKPKPTPPKAASPPPLPAGWVEYKDQLNRPYYYHTATKKTQWARPTATETPKPPAPKPASPAAVKPATSAPVEEVTGGVGVILIDDSAKS